MRENMMIMKEYHFGADEISAIWYKDKYTLTESKIITFKNKAYVFDNYASFENKIISFADEHINGISHRTRVDIIRKMLEWYDICLEEDFYLFLLERTLMQGNRQKETIILCEYLLNICSSFKQIDEILSDYTGYDPFLYKNGLHKAYYETFITLAKTAILVANDREEESI